MKTSGEVQAALSDSDLQFIERIAREAGRMALTMREGVNVMTKTGPSDLVTDADLSISKFLLKELAQRFPDDLIVSEEDKHPVVEKGELSTPTSARIWLIDPIDGTENYVKNDGNYTTMIGLLVNGAPHFGCIYQPAKDALFYGGPAYGAFKKIGANGEAKEFAKSRALLDELPIRLLMGWADRRKYPWIMSLPDMKFIPSESLGLKILKIVENDADLFVSLTGRVKLWDTAAPTAIALGAGCEAGTTDGGALPYPVPSIQHGSSVIIGRPGALDWALQNLHQKAN